MEFYFITVNYNGIDFTKEYVNSVNKLTKDEDDNVHIIVVDNNSEGNEQNRLKQLKEKNNNIFLIFLSKNIGYFKGLNKGIETIYDKKDKILIVGNNDLTFDQEFINNIKELEYDDNILVVAPNIITKEGKLQNPHVVNNVSKVDKIKVAIYFSNYYIGQSCKIINKLLRKIKKRKIKNLKVYGKMIIKRGIGACYILTPYFFMNYEKLDDRVFLWGEEALLSHQLEKVNGLTLYDPSLKVIHHESASVKTIETKEKYYIVKKSYRIYKNYL